MTFGAAKPKSDRSSNLPSAIGSGGLAGLCLPRAGNPSGRTLPVSARWTRSGPGGGFAPSGRLRKCRACFCGIEAQSPGASALDAECTAPAAQHIAPTRTYNRRVHKLT